VCRGHVLDTWRVTDARRPAMLCWRSSAVSCAEVQDDDSDGGEAAPWLFDATGLSKEDMLKVSVRCVARCRGESTDPPLGGAFGAQLIRFDGECRQIVLNVGEWASDSTVRLASAVVVPVGVLTTWPWGCCCRCARTSYAPSIWTQPRRMVSHMRAQWCSNVAPRPTARRCVVVSCWQATGSGVPCQSSTRVSRSETSSSSFVT
jgi:hypothetical protein